MKRNAPLARKTPLRAKSPMRKRSRVRKTAARSSANGQDCCLRLPGCPNDTSTTVLAHLRMFGGGGIGLKPDDTEAVFADEHCHSRIDGRVPWIRDVDPNFNFWEAIARAIVRTHRIMRASGVLVLKGEQ